MRHSILSYICGLGMILTAAMAFAAETNAKPAPPKSSPTEGAGRKEAASADEAPTAPKSQEDAPSAEDVASKPRKKGARPTSIDITPLPSGQKTLTIHFRWSLYPNSSIEVRLVPSVIVPPTKDKEGEAKDKGEVAKGKDGATKGKEVAAKDTENTLDSMEVAPVYFFEHLKGTVREALFRCTDHAGENSGTYSFTKEKTIYKLIGRRNSLNNQAVHVKVCNEDGDPEKNPAAAYLQLDTWAVDRETISLDLARDEFAMPGTLYVWFFRGDAVVWEEQVRWPGYR
jgi:hypothetical protein